MRSGPYLAGDQGGQLPPSPEIWQSDYNTLRSVISAPAVIGENISALPPCLKIARYGARDVSAINSKVTNGLANCQREIANHFLVTLEKYNIKHSGLYHHLAYKAKGADRKRT